MSPSDSVQIVIIGGGIIGITTAYYLLTASPLPPGSSITLIERTGIAHGASGRAAGLIFDGWHSPHILPLAKLSWDCHAELAKMYGGYERWQWEEVKVYGMEIEPGARMSRYRDLPPGLAGVEGEEGEDWPMYGDVYSMAGRGRLAALYVCLVTGWRC